MTSTLDASPLQALVIGAGAIGALYGHVIARAGIEVSVVARSDHDLIVKDGYQIKSVHLGDETFKPKHVIRKTTDWAEAAPDLLLVCTKVLDDLDQVSLLKPVVGVNTKIILIQNGIDIESPIQAAFPNNEIISALAFVQVSRLAPAVIEHFSYGELTIGTFPKGIGQGCQQFGQLLEQGGLPGKLTDDVVNARWQKCLWNAPFNPTSALTGPSKTHTILDALQGEEMIRDMMLEVANTAAAAGHPLPVGIIDQYVQATKDVKPYKTSMALDAQNRRPMETEAILGNTVRIARRLGVATPKLDTLYALMKIFEADRKTMP
jgi:2-dehydropantoate 2-reductase